MDPAISELCKQACLLRDQGKGRTVSYSPNVFIPLTRLCRNACGYCNYRLPENDSEAPFLSPDEVLAIARAGERAGCTEALIVTGDKPEFRYSKARRWLTEHHSESTGHYAAEMGRLIFSETQLYPHTNAGVIGREELIRLTESNASVGLMLETVADRLGHHGRPHAKSLDKDPPARLDFLRQTGRLSIATTTGLLIGIGETRQERLETILAIQKINEQYGHIQEVIIQNFRPKAGSEMADMSEPPLSEILWTCATARILLGADMNLQVAPNLLPNCSRTACLGAGINDWGGVSPLTPDYVNRESPWPTLSELQRETEEAGFALRPRFPVYPEFIQAGPRFLAPQILKRLTEDCDHEGYIRTGALVA